MTANKAKTTATGTGDRIPFNRPFLTGREIGYLAEAVSSGSLAGDGAFTKRCSDWMERKLASLKVQLVPSCTAALEIAAMLCEIEPGDEVILPSYTFVSTANAFVLRGASVRFVDIREDTLNIDERLLEEAISARTRAIVPVHYAGIGAEMDTIMEISAGRDLLVIEDAAQGICSTYKGRHLGTLGHLGAFSFHETKNLIAGEGGALAINQRSLLARAEILRSMGTNRAQFQRGLVDKYTWVDVGSSYLASELVAAVLLAQLEAADEITKKRREIFDYYLENLRPLEAEGHLRLPAVPADCQTNGHLFYAIVESEERRASLIRYLDERRIQAVFHFVPLHDSPMGLRVRTGNAPLPITEKISGRLLRLPCFFELSRSEQDRVIDALRSFFADPAAAAT